ncbi:hypothetical protein FKO01_45940 [Mesorhizobium sp. B2-3-3]|nr:hypothetical protein FKO01_45940 [Mesorhizobium sp. B2-3-3]
MKHFVGLDVSVKETAVCLVDESGRICREVKVVSHRASVSARHLAVVAMASLRAGCSSAERDVLGNDAVATRLRAQLGAVVGSLGSYQPFELARCAVLRPRCQQQAPAAELDRHRGGSLAYQPPADETAHLAAMEKMRGEFVRSSEIEERISLATDGKGEHATAATARDAVEFAEGRPYQCPQIALDAADHDCLVSGARWG